MPNKSKKKRSKFSAKTADKHDLYQRSVQDAATEVYFINRAFKAKHKRPPLTLREDFCGTALLCGEWVRSMPTRRAVGIEKRRARPLLNQLAEGGFACGNPAGDPNDNATFEHQLSSRF